LKLTYSPTGYWLENVRQEYQLGNQSALVGTDIVPTYFPMAETLGQGIEFRVQSITAPWPDADKSSFDLVHQRMGLFAAGAELDTAVAGLIDLVKPGGWIQLVDADLTGPEAAPDSPMAPSVRLIKTLLGKSLDGSDGYGAKLKDIFKQNGLIGVEEKIVDAQLGVLNPNPALAKKSTTSFTLAAEGMVAAAKSMPTPLSDDLDDIVPNMRKGLEEKGSLFRYWVVWGQKPL
jgi:SAM-dependent methyltransferase